MTFWERCVLFLLVVHWVQGVMLSSRLERLEQLIKRKRP
jgi:hypothetical protein